MWFLAVGRVRAVGVGEVRMDAVLCRWVGALEHGHLVEELGHDDGVPAGHGDVLTVGAGDGHGTSAIAADGPGAVTLGVGHGAATVNLACRSACTVTAPNRNVTRMPMLSLEKYTSED